MLTEFLSPAYYTSMGFAIPAAVGAGFASPWLRPIVLVGDGAFQMSGTELSTCLRFGRTPIVIVLNNARYAMARLAKRLAENISVKEYPLALTAA